MDLNKFGEAQRKFNLTPFKLSTFIQKRVRELVNGAPPLINTSGVDLIDIAIVELIEGKTLYSDGEDEDEKEDPSIQSFISADNAAEPEPVHA